ncbi:hypothetical protein ACFLUQ_00620 [Chloroflexota bacterium]
MNKRIWIVLAIIASGICFTISLIYISRDSNKVEPDTIVSALPTVNVVTWYTSLPQRDAESLANAFITETSIDVVDVRIHFETDKFRLKVYPAE